MKAHKQKIDSVYFSLFFEVDNVISVSIITMSCYFSRIIISVSVGCSLLMNSSLKASNEMNCGFFFISSVRQVTDCGAPWQAGCRNLQSLPLAWHCQIDHSACGSQSVSPASCRAVSRLAVTAVLSGCSLGDHLLTISESAVTGTDQLITVRLRSQLGLLCSAGLVLPQADHGTEAWDTPAAHTLNWVH